MHYYELGSQFTPVAGEFIVKRGWVAGLDREKRVIAEVSAQLLKVLYFVDGAVSGAFNN